MPSSPLILVTGATGYIASLLIPQLLEKGYSVRAMARQPERLCKRKWYKQVETIRADVMEPETLAAALDGVHTAYYLVHNMSRGRGYTEAEIQGARNFANAAEQAGVEHIIYLGGLADPEQHIAPHMRSRIETGVTLRKGSVPVTEFRAGVIAGSGSISFEMIRFMTELFPIIPGPTWLKNKSQPIAVQNVIDYLLAALTNSNGRGGVFEIGMRQVFHYTELMKMYANARGHKRSMVLLPYVPIWFMAFGIDLMTPVPYPIAYALVGGLSSDSLILHDAAQKVFPEVKLMDYESAIGEAMKRLHPLKIERIWEGGSNGVKALKHEGFFIDHRSMKVNAPAEKIMGVIKRFDENGDWIFANWLWRLRGTLEGRRKDFYEVDFQNEKHILFRSTLKAPGDGWMEWRMDDDTLTQTAYFAPRGLSGFLYWYLLAPFHSYLFRGLLKTIAQKAVVQ
ncbi:MAG: SDR family oxidoreductase [Anaerolineales bacterium]